MKNMIYRFKILFVFVMASMIVSCEEDDDKAAINQDFVKKICDFSNTMAYGFKYKDTMVYKSLNEKKRSWVEDHNSWGGPAPSDVYLFQDKYLYVIDINAHFPSSEDFIKELEERNGEPYHLFYDAPVEYGCPIDEFKACEDQNATPFLQYIYKLSPVKCELVQLYEGYEHLCMKFVTNYEGALPPVDTTSTSFVCVENYIRLKDFIKKEIERLFGEKFTYYGREWTPDEFFNRYFFDGL